MAKKKAVAKTAGIKTHAFDVPSYLQIQNQDVNKHYRFVRRDEQAIGRREMQGWEVTQDGDKKIKGPRFEGGSTLGTHDLVLMETSHENRKNLQNIPEERSRRRIEGSIAQQGLTENTTSITEETLPQGEDPSNIFDR